MAIKPLALAKDTFNGFMQDDATWKAAALSYYTVFALAPLLVLLLQVAGLIWDAGEVRSALTSQFGSLMGQQVGSQIDSMIAGAERKTSTAGLRLFLSFVGLAFGATGAFVSLQTALNQAWKVEPDPKRGGIKNFITKRVLSLGMVLGIAFLVLVSLALSAALTAAGGYLFGSDGVVAEALNFVLSFAVISLLFGAMFKILPDAKLAWRDVWVGALATAVLFVIGKYLIGLYIGQSDPGSTFGAAGALAVLLVWIYYAALIVMIGAEFTHAWVRQHGRTIEPEEGAVRVIERKERVRGNVPEPVLAARAESSSDVSGEDAKAGAPSTPQPPTGHSTGRRKSERLQDAEREVAITRERLSETAAALDQRVSDAVEDAKRKASPAEAVKHHPWPAIAAAVVAGAALSATRADEKAVEAGTDAAKRAARAAKDVMMRDDDDSAPDETPNAEAVDAASGGEGGGLVGKAQNFARTQAEGLQRELRRAADDIRSR